MSEPKDEHDNVKIPELKRRDDTSNYTTWSIKIRNRLTNLGKWDVIEGPNAKPPIIPLLRRRQTIQGIGLDGQPTEITLQGNENEVNAATTAAIPWRKKNTRALEIIHSAVSEDLFYLVGHATIASEAWESLQTNLLPSSELRAQTNKQRLISYRCEDTFNVTTWLIDCQRQYDSLCSIDPECMNDAEFANLLMDNMPTNVEWHGFMSSLHEKYSNRTNPPRSVKIILGQTQG
jgi:hypothetical protein